MLIAACVFLLKSFSGRGISNEFPADFFALFQISVRSLSFATTLFFNASRSTSTRGPLPDIYTLKPSSFLSKLLATTSNPTSVFPAPGTPVTKHTHFFLFVRAYSIIS